MKSKEALENVKIAPSFMGGNPRYWAYSESSIPFLEDIDTIKKDLELLEELEKENTKFKKVIDFLKLNFNMSLDSKLRISDGSECVQTFITYLPENTTIDEMFKTLKEVLENESIFNNRD